MPTTTKPYTQKRLNAIKSLRGFINYFKTIPEEKWCRYEFKRNEQCCARGHLGSDVFVETKADKTLIDLASWHVVRANNNAPEGKIQQTVVAFLEYKLNKQKKHKK